MPDKELENGGIASSFIDTINKLWDLIDQYNSMIVTFNDLDRHEFDETLNQLIEDTSKHIGMLQTILETVTPETEAINDGKEEVAALFDVEDISEELNNDDPVTAIKKYIGQAATVAQNMISSHVNEYLIKKYDGKYSYNESLTKASSITHTSKMIIESCEEDVEAAVGSIPLKLARKMKDNSLLEYAPEILDDAKSIENEIIEEIESIISKHQYVTINEAVESELKDELQTEGSLKDFDVESRVNSVFNSMESRTFLLKHQNLIYHITIKPSNDNYSYIDVVTSDEYNRHQGRIWMQAFANKEELIDALKEWVKEETEQEEE